MKLTILALDGVFDTGLTALLDILSTANELGSAQGSVRPLFRVQIVGVTQPVHTAHGLLVNVDLPAAVRRPDWVVVPALNVKQPGKLVAALGRKDVAEALTHLRTWRARGIGMAGACTATFLLAEAGLLEGLEATTSWPLAPSFRQRYPQIRLDESRMIVASDRVVTAGAMMGHIDLALWLVRQVSPEIAGLVARFMLIDNRPSQARYIMPDHLAHSDPLIERLERWARTNLAAGFSLQLAAKALSVTPRTLQRRTVRVLGKSPLGFFQDLRVERAQHLLSIGLDFDKIAVEVGFAEPATLRALLRRKLGRGVRELREDMLT